MKISMKRLAAFTLALVMVLGMLPAVNNSANAADEGNPLEITNNLSDKTIGLSAVSSDSPNVIITGWEAEADTLNGTVQGTKLGTKVYSAATNTLTITNNRSGTAKLSFDYTTTMANGGSVKIDGKDATGTSFSTELDAGKSVTIVLTADRKTNGTANTVTIAISNLNFTNVGTGSITTTFEAPAYGSYTVTCGDVTKTLIPGSASEMMSNTSDVYYNLTAVPGDGYKFVGWYNKTTDTYVSTSTTYNPSFDTASTIKAVIVPNNAAVFMAGSNYFSDLNEAVAYAQNKSLTQITLVSSGSLGEGAYTIPAGITLLIPMDDKYTPTPYDTYGVIAPEYTKEVKTPYAYMTLTMVEGAELTIYGTVDLEAKHTTLQGSGATRPYGGRVCGAYGAINMNHGSSIAVEQGGILYSWGYIYGEGTVVANSGAKVYEYMQVADFPGGSNASSFVDSDPNTDVDWDPNEAVDNRDGIPNNDYIKTFPFQQYYVQNIEVELTLYAGATEYVLTTMSVGNYNVTTPPIPFIGGNGMFVPSGGFITKEYDSSNDRLIVNVNGDASMNGILLDMSNHEYRDLIEIQLGTTSFDSSLYILSLNSNITININSGMTTISQDMSLLPGVEITVAKDATLKISSRTFPEGVVNPLTVYQTGGHNIYVYDADNWGKYVFQNAHLVPVSYSPTTGEFRTAADLKDVIIDINGTVLCEGYLYSTVNFDEDNWVATGGGAAIISSGKTGQIIMLNGAGGEEMAYRLNGNAQEDLTYVASAWLKNGGLNGTTFLETAGAEAGTTFGYCATHDAWYNTSCDKCNPPTELDVTWIVNGVDLSVPYEYNTVPVYPNGTPTKPQNKCTTYTFAGWSTTEGGEVLSELPAVTTEATYFAIFTETTSHTSDAEYPCQDGKCSVCEAAVPGAGHSYVSDCTKHCSICRAITRPTPPADHVDENMDHWCDKCVAYVGEHIDSDLNHECDYGCAQPIGNHADDYEEADKDHLCDYCNGEVEGEVCYGGTAYCNAKPVCAECGESYGSIDLSNHAYSESTYYGDINDKTHTVYYSCCNNAKVTEGHTYVTGICDCNAKQKITITVNYMNGSQNQQFTYDYGTTVLLSVPAAPTGYTFKGYAKSENGTVIVPAADLEYTMTESVTLYAIYQINTYTVTWITGNGTTTETYQYGDMPTFKGSTDKAQDGCTTYTFDDWDKDIVAVTDDVTYTAQYTEGKNHVDEIGYADNGDGTHKVAYKCCGAIVTASETCTGNAAYVCQDGECIHCGADMAATKDHAADYDCDKNCNICGDEIWPDADHERVHDCETDCQHCGEAIWPDAVCVSDAGYPCEDGNCIYCGEPVAATDEHDWADATCTAPKTCSWCGAEDGDALGHGTVEGWDYIEYEGYHEVWCKDCCEYSYTDDHDYGDDHECDCGAIEPYTVTFMNGDTVFAERTFYHGSPLNIYGMPIPEAPAAGYGWDGWYDADGDKLVLGMTVTSKLTFYATWKLNTYKLNVYVGATDEYVTLDATYGAKIEDVIAQALVDGKLPAMGDKVRVQNKYYNGEYIYAYYDYQNADGDWFEIDESTTMPAQNFEIMLNSHFIGWAMRDVDGDGVIDGTEYYDAKLGGLRGWQYIEEDYDGAEGGAWYYFGDQDYYFRAEGVTRVPYPDASTGLSYGPNAEDVAAGGESFIDKDTGLFYFGEDGKFQSDFTGTIGNSYVVNGYLPWHYGLVEIDGEYYYFLGDEINGGNTMATGDVYVLRNKSDFNAVIGGIYTFDNDGAMKRFHGIEESELFEGKRFYIGGQLMIGAGLQDIYTDAAGITNYFYVNSYGQLILDAEYYIGANILGIPKGIYYFDAEGFLVMPEPDPVKNGFYYEDGAWYYYTNGVKGYCAGLINTTDILWYETAEAEGVENQGWVYVKSDASLVSGKTYYVTNVNDHDTIKSGDKCTFGDDCLMQEAKNGIIDGYYYENNHIAYGAGLIELDSSYYYVRSNGEIVVDCEYWITNVNDTGIKPDAYLFDADGKMSLPETYDYTGVKNGVYYKDGEIAYCAGLIQIEEGKYIYVKSNGELATGEYWTTNHNGELKEGLYDFGEDGILVIE